jgi:hypothetical protein
MGCGRYAGISYNAEIVQEIALDRFSVRSVHRGRIAGFGGGGRCPGIAATTDHVARLGRGERYTVFALERPRIPRCTLRHMIQILPRIQIHKSFQSSSGSSIDD